MCVQLVKHQWLIWQNYGITSIHKHKIYQFQNRMRTASLIFSAMIALRWELTVTMECSWSFVTYWLFCVCVFQQSTVKFHFIGLKCAHCGGYNTTKNIKPRSFSFSSTKGDNFFVQFTYSISNEMQYSFYLFADNPSTSAWSEIGYFSWISKALEL